MSTPAAKITETHERKITRTLTSAELTSLLGDAVLRDVEGHDYGLPSKADVRFEDETAGSPAYRIGTKATVTITVDLAPDRQATDKPWSLNGDTITIAAAEISGDLVKGGTLTRS